MAWTQWSVAPVDGHRVFSGVAVAGMAVALGLAVLGLPNVDLHGPLHRWGIMDPFCGGTRAVWLTMQGQWGRAWMYNPVGIAAVVVAAVGAGRVAVGLLVGKWVNVQLSWTPRRRRFALAVLVAALAVLEVRQQSLAELLSKPVDASPSLARSLEGPEEWGSGDVSIPLAHTRTASYPTGGSSRRV